MSLNRRNLLAQAAIAPVGAASATASPAQAGPARDRRAGLPFEGRDATGLAALVRAGQVSPRELTQAAIDAAQVLDPRLGFLAADDFDRALRRASGPQSGPFAGVPTLIKDLADLEGVRTGFGSRLFAKAPPAKTTHAAAAALLRAGFNPIAKSAAPEFGFLPTTEPMGRAPCRNPYAPGRSSGGSSGGAASATAAGVVALAHASDGGGSIRIPASNCGLVGLKPSRARVQGDRGGATDLSVNLVVTRTVRDTAGVLAVMERSEGLKGEGPLGLIGPARSIAGLKVGLLVDAPLGGRPDRDVAAATVGSARLLERLGCRVEEARWPFGDVRFTDAFWDLWATGAGQAYADARKLLGRDPDESVFEPFTLALARRYQAMPPDGLQRAVATLSEAARAYLGLFSRFDLLVSPVLATPAAPLGFISGDLDPRLTFARLPRYAPYTPIVNLAGNAAISLPLGQSRTGLPIGVQIAGPVGSERRLLETAYALEEARPWVGRRPRIHA